MQITTLLWKTKLLSRSILWSQWEQDMNQTVFHVSLYKQSLLKLKIDQKECKWCPHMFLGIWTVAHNNNIPKPDNQNYILPLLLLLLDHVVIYFSLRSWIHNQLSLCLLLWNWKRIMEILTQPLEEFWPSIEMMTPVHMEKSVSLSPFPVVW